MTSLVAVEEYTPAQALPMSSYLPRLGLTAEQTRMYCHFYGFSRVHLDQGGSLADLLVAAAERVAAPRERVRYLLHARTMLVAVPYPVNPLHEVRDRLGLSRATAFTVSEHACASGLLAVDLAGRMLADDGDPDALAMVLTGEKVFTRRAALIPDDAVMGETAVAALVRFGGERDRVLGYASESVWGLDPDPWSHERPPAEVKERYPRTMAEVVLAALDRAGVAVGEVRAVLPHSVNQISLLRLAKLLGIPVDRFVLDKIAAAGHCFCGDPFLAYRSARARSRLAPGDHYVMTGVGLGTTFSAMVLRH